MVQLISLFCLCWCLVDGFALLICLLIEVHFLEFLIVYFRCCLTYVWVLFMVVCLVFTDSFAQCLTFGFDLGFKVVLRLFRFVVLFSCTGLCCIVLQGWTLQLLCGLVTLCICDLNFRLLWVTCYCFWLSLWICALSLLVYLRLRLFSLLFGCSWVTNCVNFVLIVWVGTLGCSLVTFLVCSRVSVFVLPFAGVT